MNARERPGQGAPPAPAATGLASPGARAVLVGADSHAAGSDLPGLPSVATTLDDLARVLHDVCGMATDRIHRVPPDAGVPDVVAAVEDAVEQATGVVLFCYVGHGLLGPADELYLATRDCLAADRVSQAVPYRTVRDLLGRAPGGSVVLLDCCFSGRAMAPDNGARREPFVSAHPDGSFLLASASYFAVSFAPDGERHTLFGGRLLRLLEQGDPGGPPWLTLDRLHGCLDQASSDDSTRPHRQSAGTLGGLVVAPNNAYRPGAVPEAEPPADVPCPYPGMEPFRPRDSGWFFGREAQTARLLTAVRDPMARTHPVILVGASGAGKSSLLRAGLLAATERAHESGDDSAWPALLLAAPGPRPLRALAGLWSRASGREAEEAERELAEGRFPAPPAGRSTCRLLVIDQFEEVFTRCPDPAERARFIRALWGGTTHRHGDARPRIVLAVRADHYGNCLAYPELRDALDAVGPLNLPPLDQRALRAVIERPAADAGLLLQDGLSDRILEDLNRSAGHADPDGTRGPAAALPFLAHALRETWLRRSGAVLTLAGYQATGGIWQSVTTSSERLHETLDEAERRTLRDLLLRMVHLTPGADPVPRRMVLADVAAGRGDADRERLAQVCDRLTTARLITVDHDGVRIAHEALLRAWPRLRSWILDARAELIAYQRLAEAATAWAEHDRGRDYLFTGSRLAAIRPWLREDSGPSDGPGVVLTAAERDFARACVRAARHGRIRRAAVTAGVLALALMLTAIGTFALTERERSRERAAELASKRIAAQADALRSEDPVAALDMSLVAYRRSPTIEARTSLLRAATTPVHRTLTGHRGRVNDVAYREDGAMLASSSRDGTIRLWHTRDPYHPTPGPVLRTGSATALGWSPDGRHLTALTASALYVWDMTDPDHPRQIARKPADVGSLGQTDWSPDGRTLAVPTDRGRVLLWDLSDPTEPTVTALRVADERRRATTSAFHPDGHTLAVSTDDGILRLWDLSDRARPQRRGALALAVGLYASAFHPAGHSLALSGDAVSGAGGRLSVIDVTDPDHPKALKQVSAEQPVYPEIAYAPDGSHLAAASTDGRARVIRDHGASASVPGNLYAGTALPGTAQLRAVGYRPDGRGIVTGDLKGGIHLWNPPPRTVDGAFAGGGPAPGDAFDEDQRHLGTVDGALDTATIWRLGDGPAPPAPATLPEPWTSPRFLPGRNVLIARDSEGRRTKLWTLTDGRPRPGFTFNPTSGNLAISLDGRLLAVQERDKGPLALWDIRDVQRPRRLGQVPVADSASMTPAFARPGVLAVMTEEGTQIWDVRDPRRPHRGERVKGKPSAVQAASDGRPVLLAAPSQDGNDLLTPERTAVWALSHNGTAHRLTDAITGGRGLTAMASERLLAGLSDSGRPALWDLDDAGREIALQGSLSGLDGIEAHREAGLLAAWQDQTGARDLAVWRLTDADGDTELVYHVPGLTEGIGGFRVSRFSPRGDILVLSTGTELLEGLGAGILLLATDPARLAETLCSVRTGPVPDRVWRKTFPDLDYAAPCA
ncbi:caspase family protein [Streptomyces sp. NPDC001520]|uniref:caspase, EACC1-associated type n=1 Tax=Streptomyces sp. NPDC001520 TaxID=3364581 RepID=UPI0036C981DD